MKRVKKILSVLLSLAMVLTSMMIMPQIAKADSKVTFDEVSLLKGTVTSSTDEERGTGKDYDGLIMTCTDISVDYFKITYTVDNASKLQDWTWLFNFMPYTSSWEGWQCNAVTLSDSAYDNGEYTAYISVDDIKKSCTDGEVAGINFCYCEVPEVELQLTGFYACTDSNTDEKEDDGTQKAIPSSPSNDYVKALGNGWNLGNTFDSFDTNLNVPDLRENTWGNPNVTKDLLKAIKAKGFDSVRIPMTTVRRSEKVDGKWVIDETWLARYKEVVDWAVEEGFYVMINMHHDSSWLCKWNGDKNAEEYIRFTESWEQIANYFKDEPEQVCFESINEPQFNYPTATNTVYDMLDEINLAAYRIIRSSGGNNATRMIVLPTYNTNQNAESLDDLYNLITGLNDKNIIATIHYYSEWCFSGNLGTTGFDDYVNGGETTSRDAINSTFATVYDKFVANGIGIVVGEYGLLGSDTGYGGANEVGEYVKYLEHVNAIGKQNGFSMMFWDAGNYINRRDTENYAWNEPRLGEIIDASMNGRSSTAACLDEIYIKEVTGDIEIPLLINGPKFVGIEGLSDGKDYTYDEVAETITIKASFVKREMEKLIAGETGLVCDLVIKFTSGADWHEYIYKYKNPIVGIAEGNTDGFDIPVKYNGTSVRRVSAYQRSGNVGPTNSWCKYLQFGSNFVPDYKNNTLKLFSSFLNDASLKDGPIMVKIEMWGDVTVTAWLYKTGSKISCNEKYEETIYDNQTSPEQICVYVGETEIDDQYLSYGEGKSVYGTWVTDSSVMQLTGWPATMTFSKVPTDFTIGGIVEYYYDRVHYINTQIAVKERPDADDITLNGVPAEMPIRNLDKDARYRYDICDDSIAKEENGVIYPLADGQTEVIIIITQFGRTIEVRRNITVTGMTSVEQTQSVEPSQSVEPTQSAEPSQSVEPTHSIEPTPVGIPAVSVTTQESGQISQVYTISNGTMDKLDLKKLMIRYYFTKDGNKEQSFWIDNAGINYSEAPYYVNYTGNVKYRFAQDYVEISFTKAQDLNNGTLSLQTRMNQSDWSPYTNFKSNEIKVFYDGTLVKSL